MRDILPFAALIFIVYSVIFRKLGNFKITIADSMLAGALILLFSGAISFKKAFFSINFDILLFLTGMFIIGEALQKSGMIAIFIEKVSFRSKTKREILLFFILISGFLSALLMNDTIAIIGTPAAIFISKKLKIPVKLMLLSLAFSITTGSVFSPIGNPQNLLIAIQAPFGNPFVYFFRFLFIPTMINLFLLFILLAYVFRNDLNTKFPVKELESENAKDKELYLLCKISLFIIAFLILLKIIFISIFSLDFIKLSYIAVVPALPILLFSKSRIEIAKNIDFRTLIFFTSMFIVMQSVFNTSLFGRIVQLSSPYLSYPVFIMSSGILLSQLISNVPFVSLFLPIIKNSINTESMYALLAASSTIAGNLMILGAASNVIIIERAEKENQTISFSDFFRIGLPLTIINAAVYLIYFYTAV